MYAKPRVVGRATSNATAAARAFARSPATRSATSARSRRRVRGRTRRAPEDPRGPERRCIITPRPTARCARQRCPVDPGLRLPRARRRRLRRVAPDRVAEPAVEPRAELGHSRHGRDARRHRWGGRSDGGGSGRRDASRAAPLNVLARTQVVLSRLRAGRKLSALSTRAFRPGARSRRGSYNGLAERGAPVERRRRGLDLEDGRPLARGSGCRCTARSRRTRHHRPAAAV